MSKKYFTRLEIQEILEGNLLGAKVSYMEREIPETPDNYIIYERLTPNNLIYSDDKIHLKKALIQITHYHKKKLDSIENLIAQNFEVQPYSFIAKQINTDFFSTYYRIEILTNSDW